MRNGLRLWALLSLFFIVSDSAATTDNSAQTLDTKISKIVKPWMQQRGIPGVVVEVYSNGVPHAYYFGYADMEKTTPVNGSTIFEVGSITKLFTSILLAQEVLQ